ncbi:adenylate/guanylate cyclase domain-containing protein [bacterium]|nr:adenylate/guanylate cyclase domain-containing protein [bacterium]
MSESKGKEQGKGQVRLSRRVGITGSLLLTVLVIFLGRTGLLYDLELKSYDARFMLRGPVEVDSSEVVIVVVDDETLSVMPHGWPFPRSYHAKLIENLLAAGAKQIVYDIQFTEPRDPEEDAALAVATALAPEKIIHAGKIAYHESRLTSTQVSVVQPIDTIMASNPAVAIVNETPDPDGFSRQYRLGIPVRDKMYLSLALKSYQLLQANPDTIGFYSPQDGIAYFGGLEIPLQVEGELTTLMNFYGPKRTFPTYSFSSVLDDEEFDLLKDDTDFMKWFLMSDEQFSVLGMILPPETVEIFKEMRDDNPFRDKVVFVGASFNELQDTKKTPFYNWRGIEKDETGKTTRGVAAGETPGVEWHAHALQTFIDESYIRNIPPIWEYVLIFLLTVFVFFINNFSRMWIGSLITFLMLIGVSFIAIFLFIKFGIWIAIIAPTISILMAYSGTTIYLFIREQKEKAMIRGMFSQYVPQKVVNELIKNPEMLQLGGERRRMSVLFTDVAGFTSVSEKLSPDELVQLLNEYLSAMSTIILENEGIIDKYEGDLIMAEWGAPVYFEDHAAHACRAAIQMQLHLAEMRKQWKEEGRPELKSRVGINTGEMIVGNMGCLEVFDYTVMGDAVNLSSRLEGANKSYGTTIMIGPETYKDLNGAFVTRCLDDIQVKGKEEGVRVYELLAEFPEDLPESKHKALELYNEGLELYRNREFTAAKEKFLAALESDPKDSPSTTYIGRCEEYIINPPPEDWKGVFVLTEK